MYKLRNISLLIYLFIVFNSFSQKEKLISELDNVDLFLKNDNILVQFSNKVIYKDGTEIKKDSLITLYEKKGANEHVLVEEQFETIKNTDLYLYIDYSEEAILLDSVKNLKTYSSISSAVDGFKIIIDSATHISEKKKINKKYYAYDLVFKEDFAYQSVKMIFFKKTGLLDRVQVVLNENYDQIISYEYVYYRWEQGNIQSEKFPKITDFINKVGVNYIPTEQFKMFEIRTRESYQ